MNYTAFGHDYATGFIGNWRTLSGFSKIIEQQIVLYPFEYRLFKTHQMVVGEKDIVSHLKARDIAEYSKLYDNLAPSLFQIILDLIGNDKAANEILQDTFIHCWNNISLYDAKKQSVFIWMVQIAIKKCKETKHLPNEDVLKMLKIRIPRIEMTTYPLKLSKPGNGATQK